MRGQTTLCRLLAVVGLCPILVAVAACGQDPPQQFPMIHVASPTPVAPVTPATTLSLYVRDVGGDMASLYRAFQRASAACSQAINTSCATTLVDVQADAEGLSSALASHPAPAQLLQSDTATRQLDALLSALVNQALDGVLNQDRATVDASLQQASTAMSYIELTRRQLAPA